MTQYNRESGCANWIIKRGIIHQTMYNVVVDMFMCLLPIFRTLPEWYGPLRLTIFTRGRMLFIVV
jgi:hypothetical protein